MAFGDVGGDLFQDPVREPAQRDRVVLGRQLDQVLLGDAAVFDRDGVDAAYDHGGLFLGDLASGHRVPNGFVVDGEGVPPSIDPLAGRSLLDLCRGPNGAEPAEREVIEYVLPVDPTRQYMRNQLDLNDVERTTRFPR